MSKYIKKLFRNDLFLSVVIFFLTLITYINILPNQLFYDDEELIYKNVYTANIHYFPKYFTSNMIEGAGKISNMYRPILMTSFAADHLIWGNNPFGYHLTSIILHATNAVLIFFLMNILFRNRLVSLLTATFFVAHPIQTEAIAYASGRTDPLMSLFSLLAIMFFISFVKSQRFNLAKYLLCAILFTLAILSKETAIIMPFLFILIYFVYGRFRKNDLSKAFILITSFFLLDLFYIFLRLTVLNFANSLNFYNAQNLYSANLFIRIFTFSKVFFQYVFVLIFPKNLIFSRDASIITNLFNPWVLMFLIIIFVLTFVCLKSYKQNKIFLFSFLWFFIALLPTSGIIPINNIIAEHYLYLPSVSFFLAAAFIFAFFITRKSNLSRIIGTLSVVAVIMLLIGRTILRNADWRDPITFYTKSLSQTPQNIPMRNNLADAYADRGNYDLAIKEYKQIISLSDVYPNPHHNLGNVYKDLGRYNEAEMEYKKALTIDPNFFFTYYALADLYQKTGDRDKLVEIQKRINLLKSL